VNDHSSEKRDKTLLWTYIAGLCFLLFIRDIGNISYSKFILVGYILFFSALAPINVMIPMTTFIFPLLWGLPYTYILPVVIVLYLIKNRNIKKQVIILLIVFFSLELITSFWYPKTDMTGWIKYFSILAIFFLFLYEENVEYELAIKTFFLGSAFLMFVIIVTTIKTAPSNWLFLFAQGWFRFGNQVDEENGGMILRVNANTMAYYSVVGMAIGFCIIKKEHGIHKMIAFMLTLLFALGGILTVSRSWVLVTFLCLLMFVFEETKSLKTILLVIGIALLLAFIGYRVVMNTPELLEGFLTRWTDKNAETAGGRTALMAQYHEAFISNARFWFMGTGVTQYKPVTGIYNSFHNAIQQIFVCYGIPGAIVYFIGMLNPIIKIRGAKKTLINWIPFVAVVAFVQTIQFINPGTLMLPYVIAVFVLKQATSDRTLDVTDQGEAE
jgi:hypothetical protein